MVKGKRDNKESHKLIFLITKIKKSTFLKTFQYTLTEIINTAEMTINLTLEFLYPSPLHLDIHIVFAPLLFCGKALCGCLCLLDRDTTAGMKTHAAVVGNQATQASVTGKLQCILTQSM